MNDLEKYDILIHLACESDLSPEEQLKGIQELFPKFSVGDRKNSHLLTDFALEQYAYSRSLGLSIADSAHASEMSSVLVTRMLEGEGLSLEALIKLAKTELFARATMKRKHLSQLDEHSTNGDNLKATVAFLEKIYPKHYGQKATVDIGASDDLKKKWEVEVTHVHHEVKDKK